MSFISWLAPKFGFFLMGIVGAIFANSTGAGGGVVFLPVFHLLGLSTQEIVATSFGIQCFGMTAGAISWYRHFHLNRHSSERSEQHVFWPGFLSTILYCSLLSITGLYSVYLIGIEPPGELKTIFKLFSLVLGVSILLTLIIFNAGKTKNKISSIDFMLLGVLAVLGGAITAWLSVGVGELVAFYLILRRYNVYMAVAIAVIISAVSVWAAAPVQLVLSDSAQWQIIMYAGPGAIIGGVLAKLIASRLSIKGLKIFFAVWLVAIGIAG